MSKPILGIIGGGQLGSMLAIAANKLEIKTVIFCDDIDAPAQNFSNNFVHGEYNDQNKIKEFLKTERYLIMESNHKIPVARQRKSEFLDKF